MTSFTQATGRLTELKALVQTDWQATVLFLEVGGGQGRGPTSAVSLPSRSPTFPASTIITQTSTVLQTSKPALPWPHPTHLLGKGPFLILPSTTASQLQPWDNSGSTPAYHSEEEENVLRFI